MLKYCGYEVGKDITEKEVDKLFLLVQARFPPERLITVSQDELNKFAKDSEKLWRN